MFFKTQVYIENSVEPLHPRRSSSEIVSLSLSQSCPLCIHNPLHPFKGDRLLPWGAALAPLTSVEDGGGHGPCLIPPSFQHVASKSLLSPELKDCPYVLGKSCCVPLHTFTANTQYWSHMQNPSKQAIYKGIERDKIHPCDPLTNSSRYS